MTSLFHAYIDTLHETLLSAKVTSAGDTEVPIDEGLGLVRDAMIRITKGPNKIMFIGNGGSAGIAGHMAIDFSKNGGVRSLTFNESSSLTCIGNDLGYDQVFSTQVKMLGAKGDVLIAISSSGESKNILNAVESAKSLGCFVVTLSGFSQSNTLRSAGDINFYVKAGAYGFIETAHQAILLGILDTAMRWTEKTAQQQPTQLVS